MPQFQTLEQAFEWFLEHVFPTLPTEAKRKLKNVKHEYYKEGVNVSTKRMSRVLNEYTDFEILYDVKVKNNV